MLYFVDCLQILLFPFFFINYLIIFKNRKKNIPENHKCFSFHISCLNLHRNICTIDLFQPERQIIYYYRVTKRIIFDDVYEAEEKEKKKRSTVI